MSEKLPANVIKISPSSQDQTDQEAVAAALVGTPIQSSLTMISYLEPPFTDGLNELVSELHRQVIAVNKGDMRQAEGLLVAQAHSLDAIYNRLAQWAMSQQDIGHFATLLKLGLRAQSQSARTLEVLSGLKNPANVAIVKQANIANTQQVNNGTPAGQPSATTASDPQLEHIDGNYLDPGTATAEIRIDPTSQTVAKIHRPEDVRRQS